MPRGARPVIPDEFYHVYDRGNGRQEIFRTPEEFDFFLALLKDGKRTTGMRVLAFCLMGNHWHLLLRPRAAGDLAAFVARAKQVHTRRWHAARRSAGTGHLYQSRYRSQHLQSEEAVITCCRYIERNPLAAGLVNRAEDWPWGSLRFRLFGDPEGILDHYPLPEGWRECVNAKE